MSQTIDAYESQLAKIGLGRIKADAPAPFCSNCHDTGTYEVFYFKGREHPIIGYAKVLEVMPKGWRALEHYSEVHRCQPCHERFTKKHNDLMTDIKNSKDDEAGKNLARAELLKLWGRQK